MALCETCQYWAREFASLDEHHPACPFHPSANHEARAMPGPVSDAHDPEWGTAANGDKIRQALGQAHEEVSRALGDQPPMYVLELLRADLPAVITAALDERTWRLIRFALERAGESI